MLKTNSKQVKEKIDAYILASFRDYAQREAEGRDIKEVKDYIARAVDLVGDILEQTKEERNQYTEEQAEKLMTSLLYRALDPFIFRHFCQAIDLEKLNRGE